MIDKVPGPCRTFSAHIKIGDVVTRNPKTFFPSNWAREKVMKEIIVSLEKIVLCFPQKDKRLRMYGIYSEGFVIKTIFDKAGRIVSSYPVTNKILP